MTNDPANTPSFSPSSQQRETAWIHCQVFHQTESDDSEEGMSTITFEAYKFRFKFIHITYTVT